MKTQVVFVAFLLLASPILATVTNAGSAEDVIAFTQSNIDKGHTYALYFSDKDDGIFTAITGLFSQDKEDSFMHMIVDTDEISMLKINVKNDDLMRVAEGMKIPSYPYVAVYFDADMDDVVAGPADEDTAVRILEHKKPEPEPVPEPEPAPASAPAPAPTPVGIKDLNRPIEEDDTWRSYPGTLH